VSAYGPTAESVARFLSKGSRVGVDGRLEWREWETADHERRQGVSIAADVVQFLDAAAGRDSEASHDPDADGQSDGAEPVGAGVGGEELEVTF
jgi:single-strand DNA-binding protein